MSSNNFADFLIKCQTLENSIISNAKKIHSNLNGYESHKTIEDEIERSLSTLRGMNQELENQTQLSETLSMSTFFPLNLPLYSLILFAVAPLAHVNKVYVRAPEVMTDVIIELSETIGLSDIFQEVKILNCNRSTFLNVYSKNSDIILFTGRYENAKTIQSECPESLFIYNGSGVNPIVIFKDADIKLAAAKTFEMRTFNSGQDCAGPDAIFVDNVVIPEFQKELQSLIQNSTVGHQYKGTSIDIGPIMRRDYVTEIHQYLERNNKYLKNTINIDIDKSVVYPHLLVRNIDEVEPEYQEFFAPIFNVIGFDTTDSLIDEFASDFLSSYSMYISCFGNPGSFSVWSKKYAQILVDQIVNDVEQGNSPYGGFGEKSNFISFGGKSVVRPLIINKEVHDFYQNFELV